MNTVNTVNTLNILKRAIKMAGTVLLYKYIYKYKAHRRTYLVNKQVNHILSVRSALRNEELKAVNIDRY